MYHSFQQMIHHHFVLHQQTCDIFLLDSFFQAHYLFSFAYWWCLACCALASTASTDSTPVMDAEKASSTPQCFFVSLEKVACKRIAALYDPPIVRELGRTTLILLSILKWSDVSKLFQNLHVRSAIWSWRFHVVLFLVVNHFEILNVLFVLVIFAFSVTFLFSLEICVLLVPPVARNYSVRL